MDRRTEDLDKLQLAEFLIHRKIEAVTGLTSCEEEKERLEESNKTGVTYQQWHPTNNAEKAKKEIEEELRKDRNTKLRSLKLRTILGSAIPGGIAVIGFLSTVGDWDAIIPIMFLMIPIVTFPTLVVTAIVNRKRLSRAPLKWKQQHYLKFEAARQKDEKNTQLNYQQKAILDEELRQKNTARLNELQPLLEEYQKDYDYYCAAVNKLNFLGQEDMTLNTVGELIRIIESHRADNITAALLVYDEQQARIRAQKAQEEAIATTRAIAQQMAEAEELRREEQYLRDRAEEEHRRRMEELARQQISELEKQRKDNYNYQRINELENAAYRRRMEELAKEQAEELERQRKDDYDYRKYGRINNP